ncbi:MAG TPA: hypothetical protein VM536_17030, partial [Chloroflexia bacterium]|nr:hypothetical protein [Chloroflexia bacterium]
MTTATRDHPAHRRAPSVSTGTLLRGRPLLMARCAFLLIALLTVAVLLVNVPPTLQYFSSICDSAPCDWGRIVPEQAAQPSLALYAMAQTLLILAFAAGHFAVAAVIAWRKSDDWMALLVALFLITHG